MYARKMRSPILKILKSQIEPLLQNVRAAHKKANGYSDASMKIHKKEDGQWKVIPLTYIFEQCISTINQYLNIDDEYFKDSKEKIKSHLRGLKELRDASENPTLKINPVLNCLESLKKDISSIEEELKQSTSIHHL